VGLAAPAVDFLAVQAVVNRFEGAEDIAIARLQRICATCGHELNGNVPVRREALHFIASVDRVSVEKQHDRPAIGGVARPPADPLYIQLEHMDRRPSFVAEVRDMWANSTEFHRATRRLTLHDDLQRQL
jgi:hypothetical protein